MSDVIIEELEPLKVSFEELEFYEHIRDVFEKIDVSRVVKWVEKCILEKRKKFEEKTQSIIPLTAQTNQINHKMPNPTPKRSAIKDRGMNLRSKAQKVEKSVQKIEKVEKPIEVRSKTVAKDENSREKEDQERNKRLSFISMASKARKSMPGSGSRFSTKYIFKSTKKTQTQ